MNDFRIPSEGHVVSAASPAQEKARIEKREAIEAQKAAAAKNMKGPTVTAGFDEKVLADLQKAYPGTFADNPHPAVVNPTKMNDEDRQRLNSAFSSAVELKNDPVMADGVARTIAEKQEKQETQEKQDDPAVESEVEPPVEDDVIVSEKDMDNYFISIMDDTPYTETHSFFDDRFVVKLRSRTVTETEDILHRIQDDGIETAAGMEWAMAKYYMIYSLVSITTPKGPFMYDRGNLDNRLKNFKMDSTRFAILLKASFNFDKKIEKMRKTVCAENF